MDLTHTLGRLDAWLLKHRSHYHLALRPGASADELEALKMSLSALPEELRVLLAWHNGQSDESLGAFEHSWRLMSARQIAEDKTGLLDPDGETTGWQTAWIPFLGDGYGNYLCLDASENPAPVRAFWAGNSKHEVIAKSLADWLSEFVRSVEAGRYVEESERGTFLRR